MHQKWLLKIDLLMVGSPARSPTSGFLLPCHQHQPSPEGCEWQSPSATPQTPPSWQSVEVASLRHPRESLVILRDLILDLLTLNTTLQGVATIGHEH